MTKNDLPQKLAKISEIMADGYYFAKLRFLLEGFKEDDIATIEIYDIVEKFYKLCKYVENK